MNAGKILVVDDSELLHTMYDLVLMRYRSRGTQIIHARNGAEALQQIKANEPIDVVLLDVNMPVMTGLQLLSGLRAIGLLDSLKIIMVSTEGCERDVERAMSLGAVGYVTKPFTPSDLHTLIDRFGVFARPQAAASRMGRTAGGK